MNRKIITDKNMLELNPQGDYTFPINFMNISILNYPAHSFPYHWHPEIEIEYILEGEMNYQVNQASFHVREGDCVFINQNVLHSGTSHQDTDCKYACILFNPSLIYGFEHSILNTNYVTPVLSNQQFDYALFTNNCPEHLRVKSLLEQLIHLNKNREDCYELQITGILCELWCLIFHNYQQFLLESGSEQNPSDSKKIKYLKDALTFVYENYESPITLDEIAASCHISKSRFCRIFKESLHQTPFDFLLRYRIKQSLPLLCAGDHSITEVATSVGFSSPSYYAEVFKKYMFCSPTAYKKEHMK